MQKPQQAATAKSPKDARAAKLAQALKRNMARRKQAAGGVAKPPGKERA